MTRRPKLWELISGAMSTQAWTSLGEIYVAVERSGVLDHEDQLHQAPLPGEPGTVSLWRSAGQLRSLASRW